MKIHVCHLLKKLGADGRAEAIRIALDRGIVHLPSYLTSQARNLDIQRRLELLGSLIRPP